MEFRLGRNRDGVIEGTFTVGGVVLVEPVPTEALKDRQELLKYCQRRVHALVDKIARQRPVEYKDIDKDLGKDYEVSGKDVVEKATKTRING